MQLRELQNRFAASLASSDTIDSRIAVYRNTIRANYRNALSATYRVVRALVGNAFFDGAVDAYVAANPSTSGDLNAFGGTFGHFLAGYAYARRLPYLPDVARLEWAIDETSRAADPANGREGILTALARIATEELPAQRFVLDPSCRLMTSPYPVYRIWQVHQPGYAGDLDIDFGRGADHVLARRSSRAMSVDRLAGDEFAWLAALHDGADLATALEGALRVDPAFDLGRALHARIGDGTLTGLKTP